jgi:hypothetical protein
MNASRISPGILCAPHLAGRITRATLNVMRHTSIYPGAGETTMRKIAVLLGIVAIAAAPSMALAKTYAAKPKPKPKHHYVMKHHKHYAKKKPAAVASADPNQNTYKLFGSMFK